MCFHATAGYTEASFDSFVRFDDLGTLSRDRTFSGYFVGGGVDTRLGASNWFLRLEYRFTQFDSERLFREEDLDGLRVDLEPSMHTARATLTYKFGGYGWGANGWGWGK